MSGNKRKPWSDAASTLLAQAWLSECLSKYDNLIKSNLFRNFEFPVKYSYSFYFIYFVFLFLKRFYINNYHIDR